MRNSSTPMRSAVIQGGTMLVATTFVIVNLVVDVLYAVINPRISVR